MTLSSSVDNVHSIQARKIFTRYIYSIEEGGRGRGREGGQNEEEEEEDSHGGIKIMEGSTISLRVIQRTRSRSNLIVPKWATFLNKMFSKRNEAQLQAILWMNLRSVNSNLP